MKNKIRMQFSIYSNENSVDTAKITEYLQIIPTDIHNKGENIILHKKGERIILPALYKYTEWRYDTGYIHTSYLMDVANEFLKIFGGKEEAIRYLCNQYSLTTEVMFVVVQNGSEHYPSMRIDKAFLHFLGNIGAGMNFDILE